MDNIYSIKNIRVSFINKNNSIEALPGIYCWWFQEEDAKNDSRPVARY